MSGYYLLDYNPGTPQYTFPRRGGAKLSGTVIMHTAECLADNIGEDTSAEGCAHMIANRADWGSYHCICDSDSRIDMAPWEYEVWGDTETNNWAVHISAALRTIDWKNMPADREDRVYRNLASCAADFVVYMRKNYNIEVPRKRITGAQARARVPVFCAHGDSGVSRSDPGVNFDWDRFFKYTNQALEGTLTQEDEVSAQEVLSWPIERKDGKKSSVATEFVNTAEDLRVLREQMEEVVGNVRKVVHSSVDIKAILENRPVSEIVAVIPEEIVEELIEALAAKLAAK